MHTHISFFSYSNINLRKKNLLKCSYLCIMLGVSDWFILQKKQIHVWHTCKLPGISLFISVMYTIHVLGVTKFSKPFCSWLKWFLLADTFLKICFIYTYIASFILQTFTRNVLEILWVDASKCFHSISTKIDTFFFKKFTSILTCNNWYAMNISFEPNQKNVQENLVLNFFLCLNQKIFIGYK